MASWSTLAAARYRMQNTLIMTLIILLGAATPTAAKYAMAELPPLSTGLMRFGLAAVLIQLTRAVLRLVGQRERSGTPARFARQDWPRLLLAAGLCVPLNQACFLTGVKLANASHAGLLYALNPLLTFGLTLLAGQAVWSTRLGIASALAFCGAVVLAVDGLQLGRDGWFLVGDALLLAAVTTWSLYSVIVTPLLRRYGSLRTLGMVLTAGSLMNLPVIWIDGVGLLTAPWSTQAIAGFLFIAIGTSYINYLLWLAAVARMDLNRVAITGSAAPAVAVLIAWLVRGEPLTPWLLLSAGMLAPAIMLANWRSRSAPRLPQQARAEPAAAASAAAGA